MGWLSDFFRLAWGFLYWNTRKSAYRLRRGQGRCPCQHASDSGRAWETSCEAVIHWNRPERFRRLCPLLQKNRDGAWRCSVDRADVRPFWGRAAIFYVSAGLVLYLVATLAVFGFLRQVGYRVTYAGVLWPPAWHHFNSIRTDFFLRKYQAATEAGDMRTALMSLSTAYELQPQNYAAGRQLAQLSQVAQPGLSDQVYRRLLNDHPDEAEATAQVWFRALLARGDFVAVQNLAAERIVAAPNQASAWINAFLFANRRTGDAPARARLAAQPTLPETARFLLVLATDLDATKTPQHARERLLVAAATAPDGLAFFNVARELIARGFAQDALEWIERRPGLLGPRDILPLRLDALAALGWSTTLHSEVENLLIGPTHPTIIELLSAHLIRYPATGVREHVFARLERGPLPKDGTSYPAYLSLFCAAGAGRDQARLHWTAARIKEILRDNFRSLDAVGSALLDGNRTRRIENFLPALQPLPLDVSYALFEHYDPQP